MRLSQVIETDVLIIGGGAAGVRAAIEARRQSVSVLICSFSKVGYANNSAISYGGFNGTDFDADRQDSPERHYQDTLRGGGGLNRPFLVRILTERAWGEVKEMERMGVQFLKDSSDKYVRLGRGGHSVARRLATSHSSGMDLLSPLLKSARGLGISLLERVKVVSLLKSDEQVYGALLVDSEGKWLVIAAKSILLATGGAGAIYSKTTNVASATGDGYALAYDAGLLLQDMEFVQFIVRHAKEPGGPVRLPPIEFLLSKGAALKNSKGKNLFEDRSGAISFTRDALSLAVAKEMAKGEPGKNAVYLDLKGFPKDELSMKFPRDKGLLQVYPAAHFFMGGIRVKESLETSLLGLYVAGEAMGGVHGANRLGGNALAEAFVFGAIAGSKAAGLAKKKGTKAVSHHGLARQAMMNLLEGFPPGAGKDDPSWPGELKSTLEECAGVIRDQSKLEQGLQKIRQFRETFSFPHDHPEKYWWSFTFRNLLIVAEMILKSALMREESRGAHFREDFPSENDGDWRVNILLQKRESEPMGLWREPIDL